MRRSCSSLARLINPIFSRAKIVRHKEVRPAYDEFNALQRQMPPYMIPLVYAGRTPLQSILVDYCGLENFAFHLFDFADEIRELYEALLEKFRQKIEMIAQGPGRYVAVLENFTSETLGPDRFAEFHMPVYKATYPLLQSAGKVVGNHYDGKIGVCKKMIADSPIDLIESLTEPPEGDLTLAQARAALPDKLLWANINVSSYQLPPEELEGLVHRLVEEGSVKGRRLALEVSEHLPANWAQSMPVVLRALKQRRP